MDGNQRWTVPEIAWKRNFGDYPRGATGINIPMASGTKAQCRTKRGIPLGGIGTGSFMYNLAGSFGPWEFSFGDDSPGARWGSEVASGHEERFLRSAAFHVHQHFRDTGVKTTRTLATEDVWDGWPRLPRGEGTYHALFPKGWCVHDNLPAPVILKFFSPFVPRNYRLSSLPVAFFRFQVMNPDDHETMEFSIMFTFPNAPYRKATPGYAYSRKGLQCLFERENEIHGIRLQAKDKDNVPVTKDTEWVISTSARDNDIISWMTWEESARGSHELMKHFSKDGILPAFPRESHRKTSDKEHGHAGALAIKTELAPHQCEEITFNLAWDFPVVQFKNPVDGTCWWKRYKEWYPGYLRGWDIAREALRHRESIESKIDDWWKPIVDSSTIPGWLKQGALNELYYDLFGGIFWEAGCITKEKAFGNRPEQHLYFSLECNVYRDCETLDVRHYQARHMREMFPRVERDILLAWADFIMDDEVGRVPHDAGSPVNDPFFVYGQYNNTSANQSPPRINWKDLPSMFIQQAHAFWYRWNDDDFLREVYPACSRALKYLKTCDEDGDGLPENNGADTTYDCVGMHGASTFVSGLYIGACEAMASMSHALGHDSLAARYRHDAIIARKRVNELLWHPDGFYKLDTCSPFSEAVMTDALNGQRHAETSGLPDVFPADRRERHYMKVIKENFRKCENGKFGPLNMVGKDGTEIPNHYAFGVWPGGAWFTAALIYRTARVRGNDTLAMDALEMAENVYKIVYENESSAFWFNTPAIWYPEEIPEFRAQQNMRPRSIWELLLEIHDPFTEGDD